MIHTFRYKHVHTFTQHVYVALDLETADRIHLYIGLLTHVNHKITSDNDQFIYFHE